MKKEFPLLVIGAVFFLGIAALLVSGYSIERSETPFDSELFDRRVGGWILLVLSFMIPAGVIVSLFNFTGGQPSIAVALVSFLQLAILGIAVALVYFFLRRFSPILRFFGVTLTYVGLCYGTNCLYFPALSFATKPLSAPLPK